MKMKTKIFILLLFLYAGNRLFPSTLAKPQWLKEGFSAVYKVEPQGRLVITSISTVSDDEFGVEGAIGDNGTYSWNVKSLDGVYAHVDVNLDLAVREYDPDNKQLVPKLWNKTAQVKLNVDNREAIAMNGTCLGKINYWIDPTVKKGDNVTIYGKPPYEINGTIRDYLYNPVITPVGEFQCWQINIMGDRPDVEVPANLILWYDKATGILVGALSFYFDVVMMLMGIIEIGIADDQPFMSGPSKFVLQSISTNSTTSTETLKLADYMPYIAAAIGITAIPVSVYITKRTKKRWTA